MEHKKIFFEYENTSNGEYEIESAWALPLGNNKYKLDNILFYAPEYSLGDIVKVEHRGEEPFVVGVVEESGHSTVRILFNDIDNVQTVRMYLDEIGCSSEISNIPILISVDIPPDKKYSDIKKYLDLGESEGKWSYEESCISHE
jgi:hypothetical protein